MKRYLITLKHDHGIIDMTVYAVSIGSALNQVMTNEGCPLCAIQAAKQMGGGEMMINWNHKLARKYGKSAATTYWWLRIKGQTAQRALFVMRSQVMHLGEDYGGGLDCTPYRKARV